ncbi:hypothetical protein RCL_jg10239.t1 [Rhizophagus clarus]|uniref:Uncharacterized protein n=1 Tax=Rhizophagus clarus TaxID=94130 RepID=A0A8H3KRQ6_9GLOM|nr:hypothetical protein RCL_jg10239.t1 [Rhizophagus clarus]
MKSENLPRQYPLWDEINYEQDMMIQYRIITMIRDKDFGGRITNVRYSKAGWIRLVKEDEKTDQERCKFDDIITEYKQINEACASRLPTVASMKEEENEFKKRTKNIRFLDQSLPRKVLATMA